MYHLVIIDDERLIAEGIASLFPWEQIGFTAVCFDNPKKALEYIEAHQVDVVMSDIEMPEISGIEICQRLQNQKIRLVFISSHQNYEYFRSAIQYQVKDYLLKPLKSADIMNCFGKIREELDEQNYELISEEHTAGYYEQIIKTVEEYIRNHYKDATLENAAVSVNLSTNYLSKLFKEKSGVGFSEILLKTRMEKACELLNDIKYKSYDIAYYIGYDNPKSFSRAFKGYYGITPKEYRCRKNIEEG